MLCLTLIGGSINVLQAQETKQEQQQPEKKKSKLGSLVRKVGEATTGINMTNEPFIVNPLKTAIDVEFVSAKGSISTGLVSIVFKANNKTHKGATGFGGSLNKTAAFDKGGKTYKQNGSTDKIFDSPKGIWVEITLEGKNQAFENVPETLTSFELINMYCYIDANNRGLIEFRNIPITWE